MKHAFRTVNIGGMGGAPPEGGEEFNTMTGEGMNPPEEEGENGEEVKKEEVEESNE